MYLARTRYATLNQSELTRRLADEDGIALHRTTVRRILAASGVGGVPGLAGHAGCHWSGIAAWVGERRGVPV